MQWTLSKDRCRFCNIVEYFSASHFPNFAVLFCLPFVTCSENFSRCEGIVLCKNVTSFKGKFLEGMCVGGRVDVFKTMCNGCLRERIDFCIAWKKIAVFGRRCQMNFATLGHQFHNFAISFNIFQYICSFLFCNIWQHLSILFLFSFLT